jgi:hypothetical protein
MSNERRFADPDWNDDIKPYISAERGRKLIIGCTELLNRGGMILVGLPSGLISDWRKEECRGRLMRYGKMRILGFGVSGFDVRLLCVCGARGCCSLRTCRFGQMVCPESGDERQRSVRLLYAF